MVPTFHLLTLFPAYFDSALQASILGRALRRGLFDVRVHDIRRWSTDRHRSVDDAPYGGGQGMLMEPGPVVRAIEHVRGHHGVDVVVLLTPAGRPLDQRAVAHLATLPAFALVCGHYEGIDERVAHFVDAELSIGDYVLTGGEPAALVVVDAVCRLLPGVLGNAASAADESYAGPGHLEAPHYTRPRRFRGLAVPDVLLGGHHGRIARWRRQQALLRTLARRPERIDPGALDEADRVLLAEWIGAAPGQPPREAPADEGGA